MHALNIVATALAALALPALTLAQSPAQTETCTSPGPCATYPYAFEHIKHITCGPWPDGLRFAVEVPVDTVPLAGNAGYSQAQQCDLLRDAITGQPQ